MVAPYAGAWIEILCIMMSFVELLVAPYAGAWIEIFIKVHYVITATVAPYAGAWIEIQKIRANIIVCPCRSLRGGVD